MIPKAQILQQAHNYQLQPTTVQKDYVIGWLLRTISSHSELSKWIFKGGTCLKKCYFETYRFSEDLDFTIPKELEINKESIQSYLNDVTTEIESKSGLTFPRKDWKIEEYENKRGNVSFQVKIPFDGPLKLPSKSLQRVKFDLTQDELLADEPTMCDLHHAYTDKLEPAPQIRCYSINEILAEKTRALVERNGRARDVYDIVNISRNFRPKINITLTIELTKSKFEFKELEIPSVDYIMKSIDTEVLKANWNNQLAHQINDLPPVESYLSDLKNAIAWWLEPAIAKPQLITMPWVSGIPVEHQMFPDIEPGTAPAALDYIRRAARNRFLVLVMYNGSERLVEPYALRYPATGNKTLHVWEVKKDGLPSNQHKSFITNRLIYLSTSNKTFVPKWEVEL
ncbi:MAG TPA: nucleotidyl transferase AbiEii/AbiGii toxin family protein [Ignavibacteria bacterium]|nr:nucleotidyl transferase AbiEii/AbiGii toxin family protein [Ignavibacteria bacterium]